MFEIQIHITCLSHDVNVYSTDQDRYDWDHSIDETLVFIVVGDLNFFKVRPVGWLSRRWLGEKIWIIKALALRKDFHVDFIMPDVAMGSDNQEIVKPLGYVHKNCKNKEKVWDRLIKSH